MKTLKIFLSVCLLTLLTGCTAEAAVYTVEFNESEYSYSDIAHIENIIADQEQIMNVAHEMANSARKLGYDEDHSVILLAQEEYRNAHALLLGYENVIEELTREFENRYIQHSIEYPNATYVWKYLKQQGYSDYVCAGILGNMMSEVGGQTLKLQPTAINPTGYYGICQWNKNHTKVWNTTLEKQCEYLVKTMESEFNTYGSKYKKDFDYEEFCNLKSAKKAALAFAKCYERCSSKSYNQREKNAQVAYEYFVK